MAFKNFNCNLANMAHLGMDYAFSTPLATRTDIINTAADAMWTASTGSILRSSSSYTTSKLVTGGSSNQSTSKRVSIVSPIKWDTHSRSAHCMERRRQFINSTISYCTLKQILRTLGCATNGGYDECVNRLLHSEWVPDRRYIEYDERLRARPVQHSKDRVVNLRCGELDYLATFTLNELKRWLKYNNIAQPVRASKMAYMKIIHQHFAWRSPSPDSIRFKVRPKRPLCTNPDDNGKATKTKSRTPKLMKRAGIMSVSSMDLDDSDSGQADHCKMSEDSDEEEEDEEEESGEGEKENRDISKVGLGDLEDHEMIPMQLCFDD